MHRVIIHKAIEKACHGKRVILSHQWSQSLEESNRYLYDILHYESIPYKKIGRYFAEFDMGGSILLLSSDQYNHIGRICDYIYSEIDSTYKLYPFAKNLA